MIRRSAAAVFVLLLMVHPVRVIVAAGFAAKAVDVLDDPDTEYRDVLALADDTLPAYLEAERALARSIRFDSGNPEYYRRHAEIMMRLGVWNAFRGKLGKDERKTAAATAALNGSEADLEQARMLDPENASIRIALARIYRLQEKGEDALHELAAASRLYPHNSEVRYQVAMQYLLAGRNDAAVHEAAGLASIDDSYVLPENTTKEQIVKRMAPAYMDFLGRSYLYKACEIVWRASHRNAGAVSAIMPDNPEAQEVARLFFEQKGVLQ